MLLILKSQSLLIVMLKIVEKNSKTEAVKAANQDTLLPAIGLVGAAVIASVVSGIANYNIKKKKDNLKVAREQAMKVSIQAKVQRIQESSGLTVQGVVINILAKHNLRLRK